MDLEEGVERGVEAACVNDAMVEEEAEIGGVLTVIKVVFDESCEGVGLGVAKSFFHAFSVGMKYLR